MNLYTKETINTTVINRAYENREEINFKFFKVYNNLNVFVPSVFQYEKLTGDEKIITSIRRNMPILTDDITVKDYKPDVLPYDKQVENIGDFRIFCYPWIPNIVFDKWFDSGSHVNKVDMANLKLNELNFIPIYEVYLSFSNYTPSKTDDWLIYSENVLLISDFTPKYENILFPFTGHKLYAYYYNLFENENNETAIYVVPPECKDDVYMLDWDLTIYRPKLLFSDDNGITWKKYDFNTSAFITQTPDNNDYFTFSDFMSKANTYSEYLNIPKTAFSSTTKWKVMMNCYIPMFSLDIHQYINDYIGNTRIIRWFRINNLKDTINIWEL